MRVVVLVIVILVIGGAAAAVLLTRDEDEGQQAGEQTVQAIPPAPFTASLPFREPPVLRSRGGVLRGTIVAKNGTIEVSGVMVHNAQSFGVGSEPRGLLGPTLRVNPGDLVDLVLDNQLVQPPLVPAVTKVLTGEATASHDMMAMPGSACAHDTTIKPGQPQPTNLHFHGMHVTPRNHTVGGVTYYGDNVLVCLPDGKAHIRFRIPPNPAPGPAIPAHEMGTYWYHAHLHGLTDDQVYRGLAGMLIVGDSRRYLPPRLRHVRSRILSLKDIQVTSVKGQQTIPTDHDWANPTHRTVNGLVNPTITIGPGETQLWRLADTSSALWYRVALIDAGKRIPFTIVGQDGNPLMRPDRKTEILLAPGNRFDILVRAPQSGGALLETLPFNQGRLIFGEDILATVKTTPGPIAPAIAPPAAAGTLSSFPSKRGPDRLFIFSTYFPKGQPGQFLINGKQFDPNRIDAAPRLGTWERWTLLNTSGEYHPFHIHQNDFRVISINGRRVPIRSDQDVVPIPPIDAKGVPGRVVIDMPFENFTGRFVFHCHILDHEDGGMMAQVEVRA